jgi:hypothetical protein
MRVARHHRELANQSGEGRRVEAVEVLGCFQCPPGFQRVAMSAHTRYRPPFGCLLGVEAAQLLRLAGFQLGWEDQTQSGDGRLTRRCAARHESPGRTARRLRRARSPVPPAHLSGRVAGARRRRGRRGRHPGRVRTGVAKPGRLPRRCRLLDVDVPDRDQPPGRRFRAVQAVPQRCEWTRSRFRTSSASGLPMSVNSASACCQWRRAAWR